MWNVASHLFVYETLGLLLSPTSQVIKMYAWETSFLNVISKIRNAELSILKKAAVLESFTTFTWTCAPFLVSYVRKYIMCIFCVHPTLVLQVSLVTFATYSLANANNPDERLTADKAFVALSLFNVLRFPLTMLPVVVTNLIQVTVCFDASCKSSCVVG